MAKSPEELAHQEWIGYVQPVGLVVSIPAMLEAQCYVNKNIMAEHARFLSCVTDDDNASPQRQQAIHATDHSLAIRAYIRDLAEFTQKVLGWEAADLVEVSPRGPLSGDMASLEVVLPQYNETLRPTHAVPVFKPTEGQNPWMLLVQELAAGTELDSTTESDSARHWNAAPQAKFERLLRETGVPIGLLSNRRQLRLVYAPKGESSGHATFNVDEMTQVAGRPMFAALHMLLCADRMFSLGDNQRLPAILENSRKYQNTVSTKLAEQVLAALYELMRGFQAANDVRNGDLLHEVLASNPNHVYSGLLTVLMRLVFVMYAEDRSLLSSDPIYSNYYSVTGLFNRLREDAGRHPDTMNQRYGAWAQLITLFRLIYEGGQHGDFKLPARKGYLFDPERYPFLEGRSKYKPEAQASETPEAQANDKAIPPIPRVSDGVIYNVLRNLLILDGERLSYRTLDVEQIGSVYETVMGFNLEVARGKSIAIKPVKTHGAPATINLEALLQTPGKDRAKWLKEIADQTLGAVAAKSLKAATTIDELLEALDKKVAKKVTPRTVPPGAIVLQPSDERRRSGSHYTPRSLTEPIVRTTLEPILKQLVGANTSPTRKREEITPTTPQRKQEDQPTESDSYSDGRSTSDSHSLARRACKTDSLAHRAGISDENDAASSLPPLYSPTKENKKRYTAGELDARIRASEKAIEYAKLAREKGVPHPSQILDLKICDPAMGSGAFLVEACRQLGDHLIDAWAAHDVTPTDIPPDEDEVLYARRLVAQRCLYGVDKNDMAVDLAKLSLWLVTLAKDHPFTFLDHSLRHGDSLVGLSRQQIIGFHWEPKKQKQFGEELIQKRLDRATEARAKILNAREDVPYRDQERRMALAEEALSIVRLTADACVSAFFSGSRKKDREARCAQLFDDVALHYQNLKDGRFDRGVRDRIAQAAASLRTGEHPIPPFHWEVDFPEVFSREKAGFDAFVGNPPFLGALRITELAAGPVYQHWLKDKFPPAKGHADLCAYFFRTAYGLLRGGGTFGLLATSAIAHSDNRLASLTPIIINGGAIYAATTTMSWPGVATVLVAVIHIHRPINATSSLACRLNGRSCLQINSRLQPTREVADPVPLAANEGHGFNGTYIGGTGFVLDREEALELLNTPKNTEILRRLTGGDEINSARSSIAERYVITFGNRTVEEAGEWPELLEIVRERVKPQRMKGKDHGPGNHGKKYWWQHTLRGDPLYTAISELRRCIVTAAVSTHHAFAFSPTDRLFNHKVFVFAFDGVSAFALLQSEPHRIWSLEHSSRLGKAVNYSITKTFDTYPFPVAWNTNTDLEETGENYHKFREQLLGDGEMGLTGLYNRFHDPHEQSSEISQLRELHAAMDRAVLEAYGWNDLAQSAHCEFLLDYEEEEDETELPSGGGKKKSKKKKPWRLRWPDDFRDEVLARLLELNEQRHREELLGASSHSSESKGKPQRHRGTKKATKPRRKAIGMNQTDPAQQEMEFEDDKD